MENITEFAKNLKSSQEKIFDKLLTFKEFRDNFNSVEKIAILVWVSYITAKNIEYDLKYLLQMFLKYKQANLNIYEACKYSFINEHDGLMPIFIDEESDVH